MAKSFLISSDFERLLTLNLLTEEGREEAVSIGKKHHLFFDEVEPTEPVEGSNEVEKFLHWRNHWEECCRINWSPIEGNNRLLALWFLLHQMIAREDRAVRLQKAGDEDFLTNRIILGEETSNPNGGAFDECMTALINNPTDHKLTQPLYTMMVVVLSDDNDESKSSEVIERCLKSMSRQIANDKNSCSNETICGLIARYLPIYLNGTDSQRNSMVHHLVLYNTYKLTNLLNTEESRQPFKDKEATKSIVQQLEEFVSNPAKFLDSLNDKIQAVNCHNRQANACLPVIFSQPCSSSYCTKGNGLTAWDAFIITCFPFYYQLLCGSVLFPNEKYKPKFMWKLICCERLLQKGLLPRLDGKVCENLMTLLDGRELKNIGYRTTVNDIIACSLLLSLMHATCDALGDKKLQLMNDAMSVIVQIQSDLEGGASGVVDFMHTMYFHVGFISRYYKAVFNDNLRTVNTNGKDVKGDAIERAIAIKVMEDLLKSIVKYGIDPKLDDVKIDTKYGDEWKNVLTDERNQELRSLKRSELIQKFMAPINRAIRDRLQPDPMKEMLYECNTSGKPRVYNMQLIMMKRFMNAVIDWDPAKGTVNPDPNHLLKKNMLERKTYPFNEKLTFNVCNPNNTRDTILVKKEKESSRPEVLQNSDLALVETSSLLSVFESSFKARDGSKPTTTEDERKKIRMHFFENKECVSRKENSAKGKSKRTSPDESEEQLDDMDFDLLLNGSKRQRTENDDGSEMGNQGSNEIGEDDMEVGAQSVQNSARSDPTGALSRVAVTVEGGSTKALDETTENGNVNQQAGENNDETQEEVAVIFSMLKELTPEMQAVLLAKFKQQIIRSQATTDADTTENGEGKAAENNLNDQPSLEDDGDDNDDWAKVDINDSDVDHQLEKMGLKKLTEGIADLGGHIYANTLSDFNLRNFEQSMKEMLGQTQSAEEDNENIQKYVQRAYKEKKYELTIALYYKDRNNKIEERTFKPTMTAKDKPKKQIELKLYREVVWLLRGEINEKPIVSGYFELEQIKEQDK